MNRFRALLLIACLHPPFPGNHSRDSGLAYAVLSCQCVGFFSRCTVEPNKVCSFLRQLVVVGPSLFKVVSPQVSHVVAPKPPVQIRESVVRGIPVTTASFHPVGPRANERLKDKMVYVPGRRFPTHCNRYAHIPTGSALYASASKLTPFARNPPSVIAA
jgi:hypothetical protein